MKLKLTYALAALMALTAGQAILRADDDDKPVNLADTSAAVQAAIHQAAAGGKLKSVAKEDEDGTMQYAAVIEKDGKTVEAAVSLAGVYLGSEEDIASTDAPQAAQDAFATAANGGKVSGVERDTAADGTITYEADISGPSGKGEIEVSAAGKVLKTEKAEAGEKGEKGEKEDKD